MISFATSHKTELEEFYKKYKELKRVQDELEELRERLKQDMEEYHIKSVTYKSIRVSRVASSSRTRYDADLLKEYVSPDRLALCKVASKAGPYLTVRDHKNRRSK